ncbi:MAG: ATP-binding protein [Deltaproteobacteria bacterium]|nr:ATP-binding protein [Deltaproteobacteria bacterium]
MEDSSLTLSTQNPVPPLVGRDAELAHLHDYLDKALTGDRQLVFVTGEPGIGKTTLIEAFRQRREAGGWRQAPSPQASSLKPQASHVWWGWGQCIEQYGSGEAYLPILSALSQLGREANGPQLVDVLTQYAPTWLVQLPTLLRTDDFDTLQRKVQGATRGRMLRELAETLDIIGNSV